jgi:hypothetical protein
MRDGSPPEPGNDGYPLVPAKAGTQS